MKNKNFKFIFIAIILIAFTHCKKEEIKTLSVSPTTKTVSKYKDGFTFSVKSNTDWTVSSNESWCIINQSSGSENENVSVSISANLTTSQRTAIITINGSDVSSATFTVIQESGDASEEDHITLIKPESGTTCSVGSKLEIEWESSGVESTTIQLYVYGYKLLDIETSGYANGSGTWTLPSYLSNGSEYQIYIESNEDSNISDLSDYFTVTGGSSSDEITVTNPFSSSNWVTGTSCYIEWNDNISENVSIKLYNGSTFQETITSSTSSDGQYIWSLPNNLSTGSNYRIKVTSISNSSIYGYSSYFTITGGGSSDYITVTSPTSSSNWETGQSYTVYWDDNISENVFIKLYKNGEYATWIAYNSGSGTSSDGSYTWTVPTDLDAGDDYNLAVWSVDDNTIYDYSEYFSITEGSTNYDLNGYWERSSGLKIYISGSSGYFTVFSSGWQNVHDAGYIDLWDLKLRYIYYTSEREWSCENLWYHYDTGTGAILGIGWADDGTICMSEDGNSITVYSTDPWDGTYESSTYYRSSK